MQLKVIGNLKLSKVLVSIVKKQSIILHIARTTMNTFFWAQCQ